jgi:tetratricopeptide (TPR) repeat protein
MSDPDNGLAHYNPGNLLYQHGRNEEAEKEYREAIRTGPDDAAAHYNLALLLNSLSRKAEAEAEFREAVRIDPDVLPPPGSWDAEDPATLDSPGTENASS